MDSFLHDPLALQHNFISYSDGILYICDFFFFFLRYHEFVARSRRRLIPSKAKEGLVRDSLGMLARAEIKTSFVSILLKELSPSWTLQAICVGSFSIRCTRTAHRLIFVGLDELIDRPFPVNNNLIEAFAFGLVQWESARNEVGSTTMIIGY